MRAVSKGHLTEKGLKIMIGVDFEGATDVVTFDEIYNNHPFFWRNSDQLTNEVNAAIEGALQAGATEIVVRDGHGADQNLNPALLNKNCIYVNGRKPGCCETMVLGIDESYDALIFIGAHAMAGKENGVLSHTMSRKVVDYKLNGVSMGECPYNALYAGLFGVPVAFISGDDVTAEEAHQFFGNIETVITKKAIGRCAAANYNPKQVCKRIRDRVNLAIETLKEDLIAAEIDGTLEDLKAGKIPYTSAKVLKMDPPYKMEVWMAAENDSREVAEYYTATSDSLYEVMKEFWKHI